MAERPDLAAQLQQFDKTTLEILRLKYGEGRTYTQIAEALQISKSDVGTALFTSLRNLGPGAGGEGALGDDQRAKILGFIHGELEQADLQEMASKIEGEEGWRKEFEGWLQISDALEHLLAKPSAKPLSVSTKPGWAGFKMQQSHKHFVMAGAVVLVVSLGLTFMKSGNEGGVTTEPSVEGAPPAGDSAPPNPEAQNTPAQDAAVIAAASADMSAQPGAAASPAESAATGTPSGSASADNAASGQVDSVPGLETPPPATPEPAAQGAAKKMGVIASKVKVSKNLNLKKVVRTLQQQLDGKPSCVPAKLAHVKTVSSTIKLSASGAVSKVETEPKNKALTKCITRQLAGKHVAFKPANKKSGQITVPLKNF